MAKQIWTHVVYFDSVDRSVTVFRNGKAHRFGKYRLSRLLEKLAYQKGKPLAFIPGTTCYGIEKGE